MASIATHHRPLAWVTTPTPLPTPWPLMEEDRPAVDTTYTVMDPKIIARMTSFCANCVSNDQTFMNFSCPVSIISLFSFDRTAGLFSKTHASPPPQSRGEETNTLPTFLSMPCISYLIFFPAYHGILSFPSRDKLNKISSSNTLLSKVYGQNRKREPRTET